MILSVPKQPTPMIILRSARPDGSIVDTIANDHISISDNERRQFCETMNRYLVSQGSQLKAIYMMR
jgi:hypothetical protein